MPLYAAYGSNMDPAQMKERAPHSPMAGTGWLTGWRLTFGGEDFAWEGALSTVVEDPLSQVFVVLYDVPDHDAAQLDRWEGGELGLHKKLRLRVHTLDGDVLAWIYVLDAYEGGLPSARYLGVLADAAEQAGAPADYVERAAQPPELHGPTGARSAPPAGVSSRAASSAAPLGCGRQRSLGQHADAERERPLVEVERGLVQVAHRAVARPDADPGHRTGDVLQVPGEVLAAAGLLGAARGVRAQHRRGGVAQHPGALGLVDHRRHAAGVRRACRPTPVGARICSTSVRTVCSSASHVAWSPVRRVPRSTPCCGIAFGGLAGLHRAPDQDGARARVDVPGEQQRELGDQQPERLDEVRGQVRAGGVAAGRGRARSPARRRPR